MSQSPRPLFRSFTLDGGRPKAASEGHGQPVRRRQPLSGAVRVPSARKRAVSKFVTRRFVNPVIRRLLERGLMPRSHALLETTGRKSGLPRQVPVGNGLRGNVFWIVTEHGYHADYVRNIQQDPRVRVKVGRDWHSGTAHVLPDDDPRERMRMLGAPTQRRARADGGLGAARRARGPGRHSDVADQRRRLVVDAMNVIGSRPTGWWRDRRGAMTRLVEELGRYAEATGEAGHRGARLGSVRRRRTGVDVRFAGRPATRPTTRSSIWSRTPAAGSPSSWRPPTGGWWTGSAPSGRARSAPVLCARGSTSQRSTDSRRG